MATNNLNSDLPFQTPDPSELQSKETRDSVLERLQEQQGGETEVIDEYQNDEVRGGVASEPADEFANRQVGPANRTGG